MPREILANLLAGLGLFFIGIKLISEHMKQMAGRSFRNLVNRFTQHPVLVFFSGLVAGGLIQSTTAVTFIMTSLVSSRLITVRKAMAIVTWSNVGNSLLVVLAALDIHLAALYLLGIIGAGFYFNLDRSNRFRNVINALLGLGLLFLGLILIKTGAAPLNQIEWFTRFLAYTKSSYLLAFVIGGFFTFIAQSSTTISVIAIAMAKVGLLGMDQTIMIIYGSNLGSGLSTTFMASNLKGTPKQLAIFQAVFKVGGALVLVPLFYIELHLHFPLMHNLITHLSDDFGQQMAYVYLVFQLAAATVVTLAMGPVQRLLERLSPATAEEELTRPQFIYDQALEEPATALDLVEKEQLRLLQHLPEFLDAVREEAVGKMTMSAPQLRAAVTAVGGKVTLFMTDLMDQRQARESLERSLNLQNRTEVITAVAETLDEIVSAMMRASHQPEKLAMFNRQLAEALHLILMTAYDAAENPDAENCQMLLELTADRGDMMEQIRRSLLTDEKFLSHGSQQTLMSVTTLFERAVWLLRRYGRLLPQPPAEK
ncbi:MAG TPA: Na/Pi symporter [Verrucomicrobiae bacterium]|jgi:phosphate:Na+ symporter